MKKLNVIGQKYGMLEIIREHSKSRSGHIRYTCKCDCGKECNVLLTHLRQGNSKSCGCVIKAKVGKNSPYWTGAGDISGNFWNQIERSANGSKRKTIVISITKEYAWSLFVKQKGKCALTNLDLSFPKHGKDKSSTASLDRIDSSKGYEADNIQWVHKDVNIMKNKFDQNYFIKICNLISLNS